MLERNSFGSYRNLMKKLRRERYTVMVDGRINNPPIFTSTPLLMYAGRARFRVGAGGDRKPRIYNVSVPEWNRVDHYMEGSKQLAIPFGVDSQSVDWQPEIFLTDEERSRAEEWWRKAREQVMAPAGSATGVTKRLLVNLSASEAKRRWPDGKFTATLQAARALGPNMPIIVIGLPSEWESVNEVATAVNGLPVKHRSCAMRSRWWELRFGLHTGYEHLTRGIGIPETVTSASQTRAQAVCTVEHTGRDHRLERG